MSNICTRVCGYMGKKTNRYGKTETSSGLIGPPAPSCIPEKLILQHDTPCAHCSQREEVSPVEHDISFGIVKQQHKCGGDVHLWVRVVYRVRAHSQNKPNTLYAAFSLKDCSLSFLCVTRCTCFTLAGYRMCTMLSRDLLLPLQTFTGSSANCLLSGINGRRLRRLKVPQQCTNSFLSFCQ